MAKVSITVKKFLADRQGKTFADVAEDAEQPFADVLEFFNDENRQRRMEESEIHHNRAPMAGVVRELESQPTINRFLSAVHPRRSQRLRQAIGVVVRMIMEQRGWQKTGRKGSLGVRADASPQEPAHNSGGLSLWFVRAERYKCESGMPYRSVRQRGKELNTGPNRRSTKST